MTKAVGICDICGFKYKLSELQKNSYGMMVCPTDFERSYDLKNHPQNKTAIVTDDVNVDSPRLPVNLVSAVPVSAWLPSL